jgi:hypothetical protein
VPLYELLERHGYSVWLVDPHAVKKAPGRPKADAHDAQWLQRLHCYGLLGKAFRPADSVVVLRGLVRRRDRLVRDAAQHLQHIPKALELMSAKPGLVVTDSSGATGRAVSKAILRGAVTR